MIDYAESTIPTRTKLINMKFKNYEYKTILVY